MGDFIFLCKMQSSAKRRTDDLIFSGRSLIKFRNKTGPKADPWGTPDRTGTGSEAWDPIPLFESAQRATS